MIREQARVVIEQANAKCPSLRPLMLSSQFVVPLTDAMRPWLDPPMLPTLPIKRISLSGVLPNSAIATAMSIKRDGNSFFRFFSFLHYDFYFFLSAIIIALTGYDNDQDCDILRYKSISFLRMLYHHSSYWKQWLDQHWIFDPELHGCMDRYMVSALLNSLIILYCLGFNGKKSNKC